MFIESDERLIIMDLAGKETALSVSDFQRLEEVGVKTVEFSVLTRLDLDWQIIYNKINEVLENTNLKVLCPFWWTSPTDVSWLLDNEINYADSAVGKSIDEVTLRFLDGFGNNRERVQINYAYHTGGEVAWKKYSYRMHDQEIGLDGHLPETPPVSDEEVADFIVDRQRILSAQHDEVWTSFLNTMFAPHHPRRMIIDNALYDVYPDCAHYRINHWYFPNLSGDYSRSMIKNNSRSKYFIGSEWVPGLRDNYEALMEQRAWGFITAPIHVHSGFSSLQGWMLDRIGATIKKLDLELQGE